MTGRLLIAPEADGERLTLANGSASLRFVPRLGTTLPRYHLHVGRIVHASQELSLLRVQTTLLLGNDLTGQAELCDFQTGAGLDEDARAEALLQLVNAAVAHAGGSADLGEQLIAELPGWRNADGLSPFWQSLGARFYGGDPDAEQARLGDPWRSHLAALLPRQTVYLSFLGPDAAARLGQHVAAAVPIARALNAAGFDTSAHVRIDDGGPVFSRRLPAL